MKVLKVKIKQFKVLKDLDTDIEGANIMLVGDNGVGKSSFIQFIEIALGKSTNIPPDATGEGVVWMDKNGNKYIFNVEVHKGRSKVTITSPDGLKDNRKGSLSALIGAVEFDINEFVELSKTTAGRKKQVEIFKSFLPADVQESLTKFETNAQVLFDERTALSKKLRETKAIVSSHPLAELSNEALTALQPVDTADLMTKLSAANSKNKEITEVESRIALRNESAEKRNAEIERLKKQIEEIQKLNDADADKNVAAMNWLQTNKPVNTGQLELQISSAADNNTNATRAASLLEMRATLERLESDEGDYTANIESQREAIRSTIRSMKSPVTGLVYDDEQLTYNGVAVNPDSLSTSEIMELGIKLKMAENPDLGILFIQHGESLGKKRLEDIMALAKTNNWQVIMEQVERGKETLTVEIMKA